MEKKEPKIKILVACHKADPAIRQDDIYMPIHVGKALHPELDLGFQGDDTGDNISEKNGSYCELTAMYWAWKNLPTDVDIVGIAHYRRYLDVSADRIVRNINCNRIILPAPIILGWSVAKELALWTSMEEVYLLVDILRGRYPDFVNLIDSYFFRSNKFYRLNMAIMSRSDFEDYCGFIFPILEELERYSISRIGRYTRQKRVFGYIGEILIGLWIKNNKKKRFVLVDGTDDKNVHRILRNIRNNVAFFMTRPRNVLPDMPVIIGLRNDGYSLKSFNL